jgi:uncharacterized membrane protein YkoI
MILYDGALIDTWRREKMNLNRRTVFGAVAVITLALFVIAGSGLALGQGSGSSLLDDGDNDESITESNVSLSEEDAIDIATAEANGTVEEVELEGENGTPVYEVEFVGSNGAETEVAVHANDGTVLETESEDEADETEEDDEMEEDDESVAPGNVSLSEGEAIDIATAEANGTVEEVELESEDGTPAYEVELVGSDGSETEVTVHADDETVLEVETGDE